MRKNEKKFIMNQIYINELYKKILIFKMKNVFIYKV